MNVAVDGSCAIRTRSAPGHAVAGEGEVAVAGVEPGDGLPLVVGEGAVDRPELDVGPARRWWRALDGTAVLAEQRRSSPAST